MLGAECDRVTSGQNRRASDCTNGCIRECVLKLQPTACQRVNLWRLRVAVPVAAEPMRRVIFAGNPQNVRAMRVIRPALCAGLDLSASRRYEVQQYRNGEQSRNEECRLVIFQLRGNG